MEAGRRCAARFFVLKKDRCSHGDETYNHRTFFRYRYSAKHTVARPPIRIA